ncbi:MAG: DUF11 domain-containing protein [Prevotellaceae bacterium]|jgi:gliding motility-associated-like protein/uncharacterized repeat protein (TIGR01451 family)|nr:DUF11 domain-containing protein [Prevotellaceae bacterium]
MPKDSVGDSGVSVVFAPTITLTVAKSPSTTSTNQGDTLKYTIKVTNTNAFAMPSVTVIDTLERRLLLLDVPTTSSNSGTLTYYNGGVRGLDTFDTVKWITPPIGPGAYKEMTLYAEVLDTTTVNDKIKNRAYAFSPPEFYSDGAFSTSVDAVEADAGGGKDTRIDKAWFPSAVATLDPATCSRMQSDTVSVSVVVINNSTDNGDVQTYDGGFILLINGAKQNNPGDFLEPYLYQCTGKGSVAAISPAVAGAIKWRVSNAALLKDKSDTITILFRVKANQGTALKVKCFVDRCAVATADALDTISSLLTLTVMSNPIDLIVAATTKGTPDTLSKLTSLPAELRYGIKVSVADKPVSDVVITDTLPEEVSVKEIIRNYSSLKYTTSTTGDGKRTIIEFEPIRELTSPFEATLVVMATKEGKYGHSVGATTTDTEATLGNNHATDTIRVVAPVDLKAAALLPQQNGSTLTEAYVGDVVTFVLVAQHVEGNSYCEAAKDVRVAFTGWNSTIEPMPGEQVNAVGGVATIERTKAAISCGTPYGDVSSGTNYAGADTVTVRFRVVKTGAVALTATISCGQEDATKTTNNATSLKTATTPDLTAIVNPHDLRVSSSTDESWAFSSPPSPMPNIEFEVKNFNSGGTLSFTELLVEARFPKAISGIIDGTLFTCQMNGDDLPSDCNLVSDGDSTKLSCRLSSTTVLPATLNSGLTFTILNYKLPVVSTAVGRYVGRATASLTGVATPDVNENDNTAHPTIELTEGVSLRVDSVRLVTAAAGGTVVAPDAAGKHSYEQGAPIFVRVYLHNLSTSDSIARNISVAIGSTSGFGVVKGSGLLQTLAVGGKETVTLELNARDLIGAAGRSFPVTVTNNSLKADPYPVIERVAPTLYVTPGADVQLSASVASAIVYHSHRSYTLTLKNTGSYRSQGLELSHTVPERFTVDSIVRKLHGVRLASTEKLPYSYSAATHQLHWSIDSLAANGGEADVTLYVNTLLGSDRSYETYILASAPCTNDKNTLDNKLEADYEHHTNRVQVTRNPYSLTLTKQAGKTAYDSIREVVTFTLKLKNTGDSAAYQLRVSDTIPRSQWRLTALPAVRQKDTLLTSGNLQTPAADLTYMTWCIDTLPAGDSLSLTLSAKAVEAGRLKNVASVTLATSDPKYPPGYSFDEDNLADNTDSVGVDVRSSQNVTLTISVSRYPAPVPPTPSQDTFMQGDTLLIAITVKGTNAGEKVKGVKVGIDPQDFFSSLRYSHYSVATSSQGMTSTFYPDSLLWKISTLSADTTGRLMLWVVVHPQAIGSYRINLSADTLSSYYPKVKASKYTTIAFRDCPFDVGVEKTLLSTGHAGNKLHPGELFDYHIKVSNLRSVPVDSIFVADTLPSGVTYTFANPKVGSAAQKTTLSDGRTLLTWKNILEVWSMATLLPKQSIALEVSCKATDSTKLIGYVNKVFIATGEVEADMANNYGSATAQVVAPVDLTFEVELANPQDTVRNVGDLTFQVNLVLRNSSELPLSKLSIRTSRLPKPLAWAGSTDNIGAWKHAANGASTWTQGATPVESGTFTPIHVNFKAVDTGKVAWIDSLFYDGLFVAADTLRMRVNSSGYNVKLTKTATKRVFFTTDPSRTFTYEVGVENTGSSTVRYIFVSDTLPGSVLDLDVEPGKSIVAPLPLKSVTSDIQQSRRIIIAAIDSLVAGQKVALSIPCSFSDSALVGLYLNKAWIIGNTLQNNVFPDSVLFDNTDTALVELRHPISLKASMGLYSYPYQLLPADYEFRQGLSFDVGTTIENNGSRANDSIIRITRSAPSVTLFDSVGPSTGSVPDSIFPGMLAKGANERGIKYSVKAIGTGNFSFDVEATTMYKPAKPYRGDSVITIRSADTVQGKIAWGADLDVRIAVQAAKSIDDRQRAYTLSMTNKGTYQAAPAELKHSLPADLRIDSIEVYRLNGTPYINPMSNRAIITLEDNFPISLTTQSEKPKQLLRYENGELTYSIDTMGADATRAVSALLYVTVVSTADTTQRIALTATATANGNAAGDYDVGNNTDRGLLLVAPYPYNVGVSILVSDTASILNTAAEDEVKKQRQHTVVAKNKGRYSADSIHVSYTIGKSDLLIVSGGGSDVSDDKLSAKWDIHQLSGGADTTFILTVGPRDLSAKGNILSVAHIDVHDVIFRSKEADTSDNTARVYTKIFSMLDTWRFMEAFSPNGDGKNDKFVIKELMDKPQSLTRVELIIFNRYGTEVYYKADYDNSWDGAGLPDGTYFYRLTLFFEDGTSDVRGTFITIRRQPWR